MSKVKDLSGQVFDRLTVIERAGTSKDRRILYRCKCSCEPGKEVIVKSKYLVNGDTKSCGCLQKTANVKHHLYLHPIYGAYKNMKRRCYNPKSDRYKTYGARGITVCDRWLESFENFAEDMLPSWKEGLSLDRKDNDKGYCPENCRWASRKEQMNNTTLNRNLTYKGKTQSLSQWAIELNISYEALRGRIRGGWEIEKALTTPYRKRPKKVKT